MSTKAACPICFGKITYLGTRNGVLDSRKFTIKRCTACLFAFVENYRTDFANIYNEDYYCGQGADPMVDYVYEFNNFDKSIRNYEWNGIKSIFKQFFPSGGRWLDFGCGTGGLVKAAIDAGIDAVGFEEGWAANMGRASGTPILHEAELDKHQGVFEFISAIEVLEHIPDPVGVLKKMRKLLKPGGILFITTGNAQPWRDNLLAWGYTKCPDVHVAFYEPACLALCMEQAGFKPYEFDSPDRFVDIIKFKVLKNLGIKDQSKIIDALPWRIIASLVDHRHKVSKQPYGVAI